MDIFPYEPRPYQRDVVAFISSAIADGKSVVMESGTGTGKTVCSLAGVIPYAKAMGKRVIYITRTKSQQKQVISELKEISRVSGVFGIALQGRSVSTCPMMAENKEFSEGSPEEMSHLCSRMKKDNGAGCKCRYYQKLKEIEPEEYVNLLKTEFPDPESFQKRCVSDGICPYEMVKIAAKDADVVTAPYTFVVIPPIRNHMMEWMETSIEDCIIIVDEAHNMPDFLRDSCTSEYTLAALDRVEKEAMERHNPEVADGVAVSDVVSAMKACFSECMAEYLHEDDGLIPFGVLQECLMSELGVPSPVLNGMYKNMIEIGELIKEEKRERFKLPRSYIGHLGMFLQIWSACDDECYVRLINGGKNPSLEAYCMDPYEAAEPFRICHASLHMSGTLEPLEQYISELGLDSCVSATFDSPFDPENLLTLYTEDVTTRHKDLEIDPDNMIRIKDYIVSLVNSVGRNSVVFFPSYDMIGKFISMNLLQEINSQIYLEYKGMSQAELMETVHNFKTSGGAVLFAVTGGRISEGIDFPDEDLEMAIIVGLPYPKPTSKKNALTRYCDFRFGNGWNYVFKTPMIRKMRQARGRLIRSETDRGVAVILDSRVTQIYGFGALESHNPVKEAISFFDDMSVPAYIDRTNHF